jgi:hypothetical protein
VGWAIAAGPAESVVVAGEANGLNDFGDGERQANGQGDVFLLRLDADGEISSSRLFGGERLDSAYGVAVADDGMVALTGQSYGGIDFGAGPRGEVGANHFFVASLDADDGIVFDIVLAGDSAAGHVVVFAPDGGVLVQGDGRGAVDLGGGPLSEFIATLDATGGHVWSRELQAPGLPRAFALELDGTLWVAGGVDPQTEGCPALAADTFALITGFAEADGSFRGFRSGSGAPTLWSVSAGGGRVTAAGWASGAGVDLGTGPLPDTSSNDVAAASYSP